jgi:hypothetical protein
MTRAGIGNRQSAAGHFLLAGLCCGLAAAPTLAQQTYSGPNANSLADLRAEGPNAMSSHADADPTSSGPITEAGSCGDVLSNALQQDGGDAPCWAGIRTVDHWNTMRIANGSTIQGAPDFFRRRANRLRASVLRSAVWADWSLIRRAIRATRMPPVGPALSLALCSAVVGR